MYWTYTTDEKKNIDRKDEQRLPSYFFKDYLSTKLDNRSRFVAGSFLLVSMKKEVGKDL